LRRIFFIKLCYQREAFSFHKVQKTLNPGRSVSSIQMTIMDIKNLTITEVCDLCRREVSLTPGREVTEFERVWFVSMSLTLCPVCKLSGEGLEMIITTGKRERKVLDNFVW